MKLGNTLLPLTPAALGTEVSLVVTAGEHTRLDSGAVRPITLEFTYVDDQPGYTLVISFDNTCSLSPSW